MQATIAITAGHVFAVCAESHGSNPVSVFLDLVNHLAGFGRENAQETIRATMGNESLIGADVGGKNNIQIVTHSQYLLTLGNVPDS